MAKMRWVALAWFIVAGSVGLDGSDARAGGELCKLATKGDSIVAKACKEGGVEAAKDLMRKMRVAVNKGRSTRVNCKDCHDHDVDSRYDTLTKDGRDRFNDFVAEYDKKK